MNLKRTTLNNIESELRTRYTLAHVSATPRASVIAAELSGIAVQAHTARAAGDADTLAQLSQRVRALRAELAEGAI